MYKCTLSTHFTHVIILTINQIERIQNKTLYKQYQAVKTQMESVAAKGVVVERFLWHGTAPEAVNSINTKGFDRGYHGKNGKHSDKSITI